MFDPSVYENLKVVIEGEIYDRDLEGEIAIIDRQDQVNLATMSRTYSITFQPLKSSHLYHATVKLEAAPGDLYGEILEIDEGFGCTLLLIINGPINDVTKIPPLIQEKLEILWDKRPTINQQIYFDWTKEIKTTYYSKTTLYFDRKINEEHISDFSEIISLLIDSLEVVEEINQT
ncbi:MAG: hypothetical protein ACK4M9_19175 [Anaerobacillus sp.]|uniref:hypothetical protein n=1 Tax=Anaerobacillus sp. TaxID=1872506 RepID=UPI0039199573